MTEAVDVLVEHIRTCTQADAVVVVDGSADDVVRRLMAAGWRLQTRVDYVAGKRIRFLEPPQGPGSQNGCEQGEGGSSAQAQEEP